MSDQKEKEQPKPASRGDLSNTRLETSLSWRRMSRSSDEHQAPGEIDTEDPEALLDARPSENKQIVSLAGEKSPSPHLISVHRFGESSSRSVLPYDSSFSTSPPPPPPSPQPPPPSNSNERTLTWRDFLQKCNESLKRFARKFRIPDKQEMRKLGIACGLGSWAFLLTKDIKMTSFSAASALLACVSLFTFFIGYTRLGSACIFSAVYGSFAYLFWQNYAILALFPTTFWIITIAIIIYDEHAPSPEI
ncbi:hypothetical protein TIFTF001_034098 [Ficus carica]|uniref:Uncharacterized protein n=1 Tax=Ficus carica TaxID=3494 RepID=A0AA88DZ86_FICCA|nr:hypothetical protein TIFTF001_034098 [Ficus carica]